MTNHTRLTFDVNDLNPNMTGAIAELRDLCWAAPFMFGGNQYVFEAFEGFRIPARQHYLLTEQATKAGPWESPHQYGLAVDFACYRIREKGQPVIPKWKWHDDAPWGELKRMARTVGLDVPIDWDRGHVVHPLWARIRGAIPM